jgi:hypothetical protein
MNRELFDALRGKILGINSRQASALELKFVQSWKSLFLIQKWKFKAILRQSFDWIWQRLNPLAVSGLEFWEVRKIFHLSHNIPLSANIQQFKLNAVPKLVDPVKKDKLPPDENHTLNDSQGNYVYRRLASDWEFSPLVGEELIQFKGIISGDTLLHLLKYPDHAHAELPIWTGLPKKIRTKLINQTRVQVPGWGFQVDHEWNSVAFVIMTCPIILVGFVTAVVLSVIFRWPISAGVTLALGPVTLVTYVNTMIGGVARQKGL